MLIYFATPPAFFISLATLTPARCRFLSLFAVAGRR